MHTQRTSLARLLLGIYLVMLLPSDGTVFVQSPPATFREEGGKAISPERKEHVESVTVLGPPARRIVTAKKHQTILAQTILPSMTKTFAAGESLGTVPVLSKMIVAAAHIGEVLTFVDGRISWQDPIALLSNTYAHQSGVGRKSFSDSESRRFSGGGGGVTSSSSTSTTSSGLSSSDADSAYVNVSGDTMVGALSINYNGLGLIIRGTASGDVLHAERLLTVTGSAIFDGNARFNSTLTLNSVTYTFPSSDGSASGKVLKTDGAGHLSWSDDSGSSTGLTQTAADLRYIQKSGGTMTGALIISLIGGADFLGLRLLSTASGNILHAEKDLTSSGTLTVTSTARFKSNLNTVGTLSGAALTLMNGTSYALGSFGIGTSSPKAKLDVLGTISGSTLIISRNGSFSGSLTVVSNIITKGTLSGANLTVSNSASISGSLLVKTSITSKGSLSGATISGFNLGSCSSSTKKLLFNNSTNKFECGSDLNPGTFSTGNVLTLNGNKVSKSGDAMTGALTISLTSGFLGLKLLNTASGNVLHAEKDLTSSGTLTVTSTARFKSNLNTVGTLSGAALTIMNGTSYALGSFGIGTSSPKAKLDVSGTISGSNLIISQNGSFSGSLRVQRSLSGSSFFGAGLGDCASLTLSKLIYNNATGKFDCALDKTIASGLEQSTADLRYVNTSGDTMTGALVINLTSGFLGLRLLNTASGNILHAEKDLTSSGTLTVTSTARFKSNLNTVGTLSGAALTIMNGTSYALGSFGIGTSSPKAKLEVSGTISGSRLFVASAFSGAGLTTCSSTNQKLLWNASTQQFTCSTDLTNTFGTGNVLTLGAQKYVSKQGDTMTGALVINLTSGFLGLKLLNTASGNILHAEKDLTSSGTLTVTSTARFKSNLNTVGTLSGAALTIMNGTSYALGSFGIGTSSPKAKLDVLGTISGSNLIISQNGSFSGSLTVVSNIITKGTLSGANLTVSNSASISGSLLVKTSITSKGSLSGSTINGFNLGSCTGTSQKLLYNNTTQKFECGSDLNAGTFSTGNVLTLNGNKVSKSGDAMTGALTISLTSGFLGLKLLNTASGNILHAEKDLTSSGTLTVTSTARFKSNLNAIGTLSGAALTLMSGTSYALGSFGIGTSSPKAKLDVAGTISGSNLIISSNGSFSGSLIVKNSLSGSSFFGAGLGDCTSSTLSKLIYNNVTGKFDCALDKTIATGLEQSTADLRYVNTSGDAMTGALVINLTSGFLGLKLLNTASGNILHAEKDLTSSGTLTVTSTARFKSNLNAVGTLSGAALTIMNGTSYALGSFGIGTSSPKAKLEVLGTISGSRLFVASAFSGAGLTTCSSTNQKLLWNASTQQFTCSTDLTNTFGTGNVLTLGAQKYVSKQGDTMTGALTINLTSGFLGLKLLNTASGNILHAEKDLTSSGTLTVTSTARFKSNLNTVGTISGAALTIMSGTSYALGSFGIGTSSPKAKLDVSGTISGSNLIISRNGSFSGSLTVLSTLLTKGTLSGANLTVSNFASISGSLLVKTSITSKGSLSGATISGFNLGSCSSSTKKLLFNNSTNKFECSTDQAGASTFGTAAVLAIGNARYVRKAGDTMTGALVINLTSGFLGLRLINTMSGNIVHAEKSLSSSGTIIAGTDLLAKGTIKSTSFLFNSGTTLSEQAGFSEYINLAHSGIGTASLRRLTASGNLVNIGSIQAGSITASSGSRTMLFASAFTGGAVGIGTAMPGSALSVSGAVLIHRGGNISNTKADASLALEVIGTMSGTVLHAQDLLRSSGSLIVEGTLSGALFRGAGLGSCNASTQKLLFNNTMNTFECGADIVNTFGSGNTLAIGDTRYIKKQGDTMTGALTINLSSGFLGLKILQTASGNILHAEQSLTSSGTLTVGGISRFKSNLNAVGTISGTTLTVMKNTSYVLGNLGIGTTSPKAKLDIFGTLSGANLVISKNGSLSGSLIVMRAIVTRGTLSGQHLTVSHSASISGTLLVKTSITSKGSVSGVTISGFALGSCNTNTKKLLYNYTTSTFECGTDQVITGLGSGNVITIGDGRYVKKQGDTMTGALVINLTSGFLGLKILQTASGNVIHAEKTLTSSGLLIVTQRTVRGSGAFVVDQKSNSTGVYISMRSQVAPVLALDNRSVLFGYHGSFAPPHIVFGTRGVFDVALSSGTAGSVLNLSGHLLPSVTNALDLGSAGKRFRSLYLSGGTVYLGTASNQASIGYNTSASRFGIDANADGTNELSVLSSGNTGIGTAVPKAKLDVVGTISGSLLVLSRSASISGSLLVKTSIVSKGSISGSTIAGFSLGSCSSATTSKLLYNYSTSKFECGTDQTPSSGFSTGNVLTITASSNYVLKQGDSMTGTLRSRGFLLASGTTLSEMSGFNEYLNLIHSGLGTNSVTRLTNQGDLVNIRTIQAGEANFRRGGTFADKVDYATGTNPWSVAIGDLNGDGKSDLAVVNNGSNTVSVFLNNGDGNGTFASKVDYTTGSQPYSVSIGDLNGDGKPDLAVANAGSDSVSIFLNNGNGTFASKVDYTTGSQPYSVSIGDLNGDGKPDLAVANAGSVSVSVLLNNGNGTFASKVDYTTGSTPYSVSIGDLNGDGKPDLVLANGGSNSVSVFLNNGNGTFASKVDYTIGNSPYSVAIGDLNGDGKQDLAVAKLNAPSVSVLLNNGNGTFASKVDYTGPNEPYSIVMGDLSGDGKVDLAVSSTNSSVVSVLLNNGNGTFASKVDYTTASETYSIAIGDFNSDGKLDLAVANYSSNSVSVLLNNSRSILFASAGTGGAVGIGTSTPGSILSVSGAVIIDNNGTIMNARADAGISLEIIGTASGRVLHAQNSLTSSGSVIVEGTISGALLRGFGLVSCNSASTSMLVYSASSQKFECATDDLATVSSGSTITFGDVRYVKKQGDSMTGALVINLTSGFLGLKMMKTTSGNILHSEKDLTSSGTLTVNGTARFKGNVNAVGTISGAALTVMGGNSYLLGSVGIGTTSPKAKLDIAGTVSGTTLVISQNGSFSGSLIVKRNISGSSLFGAGLGDCSNATNSKLIYNNATGKFGCALDQTLFGLSYGTAEGMFINQAGDTATGALRINLTSGFLGLKVVQTASGNVIHSEKDLTSSGTLTVNGTARFKGNVNAVGTISGGALTVMGGNSYLLGSVGIGTTSPKAKLDIAGTVSGRTLVISQNGSFSGSLIVKRNISGSSLFGAGLGDCNHSTNSKLIYNNAMGKFACGADQIASSLFDYSAAGGTFVNQSGDTMTGALTINLTSGFLGLKVLQTASGNILHAEKNLTSSGTIVAVNDILSRNGTAKTKGFVLFSGATLSEMSGFNEDFNLVHSGLATNTITRLTNQGDLVNIGTIQGGEANFRRGGTFLPKVDYATNDEPIFVASGDLNGDGKADLAVANINAARVSVLLNTGTGTFASKVDYTTGSSPFSVAIGDLNGDGKPDLAVANYSSTSVSVFLNNGNGTFASKIDYTTGSSPISVSIGDLNGDARLDLAVTNSNAATVSIFLNNGNGTFVSKVDYTTGTIPRSVAIKDLDGDGKADLAVANRDSTTVSVLLNNGNGTFAAKVDYTTGSSPFSVSIGDMNGDGKPDLAVANYGSNSVSVFLNNGNGTFASKVDYTNGSGPTSVAIGDLNGDGKSDLAVANGSVGRVSIFLNNGNGTFAAKVDYTTGVSPESVVMQDFDNDGKPDLAVVNSGTDSVSVFLNNSRTILYASSGTGGAVGIGTSTPSSILAVSGAVLINRNGNILNTSADVGLALEVIGTMSGRILHAQDLLRSSGSLIVEGTISGALLRGAGLGSCNGTTKKLLYNNTTNTFGCGSDTTSALTFGTGNVLTLRDAAFVNQSGDAMTGALTINLTSGFLGLKILQTASGNILHAEKNLTSSGTIIAVNDIHSRNGTAKTKGFVLFSGATLSEMSGFNEDFNLVHSGLATNTITRLSNQGDLVNIGTIQAGEANFRRGGTFLAKADSTTGTNPYSVAIGDLNGDGKADLAATNYSGGAGTTVSIFLNTGNGTYATKVDYTTGSGPISVSIGDLNGDGKADLAIANSSSNTISVLLNNGNGTFASQVTYATGTNPYSVSIGDLNGDGKADIAATNSSSNTVSVFLNNGNGTFAAKVDYATGTLPYSVSIGDLNGDSKADLAVANNSTANVSVLLNTGNGTFASAVNYTVGSAPASVAIGDLNADGKADLAVANSSSTTVSVLLNNGNGTFATKVDYTTSTTPRSVAIGDLNGDGRADLAVASYSSTKVNIFLNNGNGTFQTKIDYTTASSPISVAIGDLNADGKADLAVANYGAASVSVFLNDSRSILYASAGTGGAVGIGTSTPGSILAVSGAVLINRNGNILNTSADIGLALEVIGTMSGRVLHAQDLLRSSGSLIVEGTISGALLRGAGLGSCNGTTKKLLYNNTTNTFGCGSDTTSALTFGTGNVITLRDATFVNQSGDAMTGALTINLTSGFLGLKLLNTASGNILHAEKQLSSSGTIVAVNDILSRNGTLKTKGFVLFSGATLSEMSGFNEDFNLVHSGLGTNSVTRLSNQGDLVNIGTIQSGETHFRRGGTFATKVDYTTGTNPISVAIGDLNGDGKADLAVTNYNGGLGTTVSIFLNNGNGTFASKVDYTTGTQPYSVSIGDLNGDGKSDLAVANRNSTTVSVFLNNGNGTFASKVDYTTGSQPTSVSIGDLNGDGKPDLAVANYSSTSVSVLLNNGNGTFASRVDYTTGTTPASVSIGDLSGDGKPDLAVANISSTSVSVFLNNGNGTFAARVDYTTGSSPFSVSIGDLSGDGKPDLAVANYSSTSVSVFLNNGNGTFASKVDYTTGSLPTSVSIGDLSGDGKPDLAVANGSSTSVSVFVNNGNGTFASKVDYTTGSLPESVSIGDLNGDGKLDLAVANYSSSSVSVFLNDAKTILYASAGTGGAVGIGTSTPGSILAVSGAVLINRNGNILNTSADIGLSLEVIGTMSGRVLHAQDLLRSSGSLIVEGTISGALLRGAGLGSCNGTTKKLLYNNTTNTFGCGSDTTSALTFGTGNVITLRDATFVNQSGDTMTGALTINLTSGYLGLKILQTASGNILHAEKNLTSSGTIVAYGDILSRNGTAKTKGYVLFSGATLSEMSGFNEDFNLVHSGLATASVTRLTNQGDLKNISTIQSGEAHFRRGGTFLPKVDYTAGTIPATVSTGDLNGDGRTDIVVGNPNSNTISVFIGTGGGLFVSKVDYSVAIVESLAIGDLNGDGKPDIAAVDANSTINLLINTGYGTFVNRTLDFSPGVGSTTRSISIADFNLDGKNDLAVVVTGTSVVSIFLNLGNAFFGSKTNYATGTNPAWVVSGDFNGDGKLDLAVANGGSSTLSILFGLGDGTFASKVDYTTGSSPISVSIGDFNGDGKPDLAVANYSSNTVSVLLNNGNGTFTSKVDYTTGSAPQAIVAGDISGDGTSDLIITNSNADSLSVLQNIGNGQFSAKVDYTTGTSPRSIAIGQLNQDGILDVVVGNAISNSISVFMNLSKTILYASSGTGGAVGIGTSTPGSALAVSGAVLINRNGNILNTSADVGISLEVIGTMSGRVLHAQDLLRSSGSLIVEGTISGALLRGAGLGSCNNASSSKLLYNNSTNKFECGGDTGNTQGTFGSGTMITVGDARYVRIAGGTMTGALTINLTSGFLGLKILNTASGNILHAEKNLTSSGTIIAKSDLLSENGTMKTKGYVLFSGATIGEMSGFNEDFDLVHSGLGTNSVTRITNQGDLKNIGTIQSGEANFRRGVTFLPKTNYSTGFNANSVAIGDLNGDGYNDVVIGNNSSTSVSVLLNNRDGTFATAVSYTTPPNTTGVAIGDLNGDGKADLAVSGYGIGTVAVLINIGNGTFLSQVQYAAGTFPWAVAMGDLDGDGKTDLAVANQGSTNVSILLNTGGGRFAASVNYTVGSTPYSVAIGDLNGDGKADVAVANYGSATASVLINKGNGTFATKVDYTTGTNPASIAIGDLNSDGKADLAVTNYGTAGAGTTVSIFLNNGSGTFASKVDYTTGSGPYSVSIGDLNGDGEADLAIANIDAGNASILLNKGNGTFNAKVDYSVPARAIAIGDLNNDGMADLATGNNGNNNASVLLNDSRTILYASSGTGGAVGIGTSTPGSILSISGAMIINSIGNINNSSASGGVSLEVIGTSSGGVFHANTLLRSSGALAIENDSYFGSGMTIKTSHTKAGASEFTIITDYTSTNNKVFRVSASGAVYADGRYNSAGADYAEWFRDGSTVGMEGKEGKKPLEPGEVVCIDIVRENSVRRCERSGDPNVMGIVSSNPAFVGNVISGADGVIPPGYALIGLIGQVPAMASLENGPIRAGDSVTSASIAGFIRKANAGESTVGVTLESYDGSPFDSSAPGGLAQGNRVRTINILISRRNQSLTVEAVEQKVLDQIASMNITDEISRLVASASTDLHLDDRVTQALNTQLQAFDLESEVNRLVDLRLATLNVTSSTGSLTFATSLTGSFFQSLAKAVASELGSTSSASSSASGASIENDEVRISHLEGILSATGNVVHFLTGVTLHASALDLSSGATIRGNLHLSGSLVVPDTFLILNSKFLLLSTSGTGVQIGSLMASGSLKVLGPITITGLATFLGDVQIKGQLVLSNKQAGFAVIPTSGTSVTVLFADKMAGNPIIIASPDAPIFFAITKTSATGFTIHIASPASEDITFNFIAYLTSFGERLQTTTGAIAEASGSGIEHTGSLLVPAFSGGSGSDVNSETQHAAGSGSVNLLSGSGVLNEIEILPISGSTGTGTMGGDASAPE